MDKGEVIWEHIPLYQQPFQPCTSAPHSKIGLFNLHDMWKICRQILFSFKSFLWLAGPNWALNLGCAVPPRSVSLHRESWDKCHPWICPQWFEISAACKKEGDDLVVILCFLFILLICLWEEKGALITLKSESCIGFFSMAFVNTHFSITYFLFPFFIPLTGWDNWNFTAHNNQRVNQKKKPIKYTL